MKLTLLASALALSIFSFAPASAAPGASGVKTGAESPVVLAQIQLQPRGAGPRRGAQRRAVAPRRAGPPPRYVAGRRYASPPRGYRRYDRRPGDWSRRGCVMVGPIWFCP